MGLSIESTFSIYRIFVVLIRICRARSHARTNNTGSQSIRNEDNGQRNKTKRTNRAQEAIEKNLILKVRDECKPEGHSW